MERPFRQLVLERHGDVWCARLASQRLQETHLDEMSSEFDNLLNDQGCRKFVLSLGPQKLECLYSLFLAKLVNLHRQLKSLEGVLMLADVGPETFEILAACHLDKVFSIAPNTADAVKALQC